MNTRRHSLPTIRHHRITRALLPVEQLISRSELLQEIASLRASRMAWRVAAIVGWIFFFVLVLNLIHGPI